MKIIVYLLMHLYILILAAIKEEYIIIKHISDKDEYRRQNRDVHVFPPNLRFKITPQNIDLSLRRNNLAVTVPYYVQEGNQIVKHIPNINKEIVFYHDIEMTASIGIHCSEEEDAHCMYMLTGSLVLNGKHHSIRPRNAAENDGENIEHILESVDGEYNFAGDYREIYDMPKDISFKSRRLMSTGSAPSDAVQHYQVEFLPVCDYSIYKFWYNRSEGNTETEKYNNTVLSLIEHYAYVINSMNVHYASITGQTWDIEIVYAGIYIADSMSASTWTENIKEERTGDRLWVDINAALTKFKEWLQTASGLPDYDHAMAFTGYELYSGNYAPGILGLAWFQGICFKKYGSYTENAIVEDHFEAIVGPLAAHELGHNLGSKHDGQIGCSDSDRYLMSSSVGAITGDKATNHYRFSSCSLDKFNTAFDFLNKLNFNCLNETSANNDPTALNKYNDTLYGQIYNHDEQCQQYLNDDNSGLCRNEHVEDPSTICKYLMCAKTNAPCSPYIPWEGTVCGDKKWCIGGECCDDPRAASVDPMCIFGDVPSCANEIPASPFLCYDTSYNETSCCLICKNYYTAVQDCEYGDKENGCVLNDCPSYSVHKRTVTCCKTCVIESTTEMTTESTIDVTTEMTTESTTDVTTEMTTESTIDVTTELTTESTNDVTTAAKTVKREISTSDTTTVTQTEEAKDTTAEITAGVTTLKTSATTSRAATTFLITKDVFVMILVFCLQVLVT